MDAKSFDAEDLRAEGIEDMIEKCNEKHPEGGVFAGLSEHMSRIETKVDEKEKEIDNPKLQYFYVETLHFITQSKVSCNKKASTSKVQYVKKNDEYHKMKYKYEKLRIPIRENAQKCLSYERMHQVEQSENHTLKKKVFAVRMQ